jgi:bacteriorhodopsin
MASRVKQSVDNSIERLGEKVNKAAVLGSGWHWIWVAPMGAFGALLLLVGIVDFPKKPENLFIGVPLIIPLLLKIFRKH